MVEDHKRNFLKEAKKFTDEKTIIIDIFITIFLERVESDIQLNVITFFRVIYLNLTHDIYLVIFIEI